MSTLKNDGILRRRNGSVLILVILMLALMVSMAIGFMSIVGRQLGSALTVACQTKADVAVQQAQAHTIKTFIESVAETRNDSNAVVKYSTTFNPQWRKEFAAVTDPDGDPFTDDGLPLRAGADATPLASTSKVSDHALVNSRLHLFDMIGANSSDDDSYGYDFGFGWLVKPEDYISRWHNVEYLDEGLAHIEIDDSLPEASKAVLRKSARYVVRYMSQVMDVNGMRSINHNFPLELLDKTTIAPGPNPVTDLHAIRYQNYLACYGRSLKSQFSSGRSDFVQFRSDDRDFISVDPLDHETASLFVDGQYTSTYYTSGMNLDYDIRLRVERAFRNGDLQWMNGALYSNNVLTAGHKGRLFTWGHISEVFMGNPLRTYKSNNFYTLVPYADSMLDDSLADADLVSAGNVKPDPVSTPWQVNLLTAPATTLGDMVRGLSSELRFSKSNAVVSKGSGSGNLDLFGKNYPEQFPLGLDAGRDVAVVGDGTIENDTEAPFWYNMGSSNGGGDYVFVNARHGGYTAANPGYQNSYFVDIAVALELAIRDARQVWVNEQPLSVGATLGGPDIYQYMNGANDSFIDIDEDDREQMINLILKETYRILGEGRIVDASPALSENFYQVGQGSLLEREPNFVGAGSNKHYQRLSQLPRTANTRAMEYALNDFMISLFGRANPYYDYENDPLSNIAVDFNGDDTAESTVTGWIDNDTGLRTWSWWWDGLGPHVAVLGINEYMKKPGWYRFDGLGGIKRKVGHQWVALPDTANFKLYNNMWLTGNDAYPIKAFAKTGRLFIGKSKVFYGFVRGEVYNLLSNEVSASMDRNFSYRVDPNRDGDFTDNHVLIQTDATVVAQ